MGSATLDPLSNKAIEAALNNNWVEAVSINATLLKTYPDDVETLNRLARAYYESGKIKAAKSTYKAVLKIDPYNPIATKNIQRLADMKESNTPFKPGNGHSDVSITDLFLEDPGTTKMIGLATIKSASRLKQLRTGDKLILKSKYNDVVVLDTANKELGSLDTLWSKRIAEAVRAGCSFEAYFVSTSSEKPATIFVRETVHSKQMGHRTVFPIEKFEDFRPYVSEEALALISSKGPAVNNEESRAPEESQNSENASLETLASKEQDEMDNYNSEDS